MRFAAVRRHEGRRPATAAPFVLRIAVADACGDRPSSPATGPATQPDDEPGRGLLLVTALLVTALVDAALIDHRDSRDHLVVITESFTAARSPESTGRVT
ncbi:hypothetical protein ABT099_08630 [Streptomyces prasinus]|uniref:hypothetical protein n=1 Tax=Streptomyces prasinus TaxID=67345 RepID=UPI00331DB4F3